MSENTETPKTISVRMVEYYNTMLVKEPVEIQVEEYPELNGMTEEEMQEYISENWGNMKPTNDEWYESLWEECNQAEIVREKITNNEFECNFE
jgi:hypothetical protein